MTAPRKPRPRFRQERWIWYHGMLYWPVITAHDVRNTIPPSKEQYDELFDRIERLVYQKLAAQEPDNPLLRTERVRRALEDEV